MISVFFSIRFEWNNPQTNCGKTFVRHFCGPGSNPGIGMKHHSGRPYKFSLGSPASHIR